MRHLDVCSGYSAASLAWEGLGIECAGYSEIEAFPRAILEQRHGAVAVDWEHRWTAGSNVKPLFGDFTKIEAHHVGPVDLLAGGTPCQSFSVAGKRLGLDDPRGNLTLEFLALARRLRVEWLVWESVPGFLSHDEGRTMGAFLRLLGECGYGFAYRVLDAQYVRVDGHPGAVPQRRRRLFVVGHLGDAAGPAAVLFERESLRGDAAPRREAREGVARPLASGSQRSSGYRNDADTAENLIAATLDASFGRLQGCSGQDLNHGHSHLVAFGGNDTRGPIDVATAKSAHGGPHGGPHGRLDFESETFVAQEWAVRRLTPTECERLMGVPDGFTAITYRGKAAADGPRYKALGNSQATNVMRWIGRGLVEVIHAQDAADVSAAA